MSTGALPTLSLLVADPGADYALLDSGNGRKLERCGPFRFIRPEAQAMWNPASPDWSADGEFVGGSDEDGGGRWHLASHVPSEWEIGQAGVRLLAMCTPFRHLGFFPDMAPHWQRLAAALSRPRVDGKTPQFLNLFGYSGAATLVAASAGAQAVHVDASRKAVELARRNAALSCLSDAPIRWLVEDARSFVAREVRRSRCYDAILLDPPKYGRGPKGEIWHLERDLAPLLADCARLLRPESRLLILTTYAIRLSALALHRLVQEQLAGLGGEVSSGE
ncbi:MAG: RsmD family RNA methyltransferase, partial [Thermaurantiacus sp.]